MMCLTQCQTKEEKRRKEVIGNLTLILTLSPTDNSAREKGMRTFFIRSFQQSVLENIICSVSCLVWAVA